VPTWKLLNMQSSPACYLIPLGPLHLPQTLPFANNPQIYVPASVAWQLTCAKHDFTTHYPTYISYNIKSIIINNSMLRYYFWLPGLINLFLQHFHTYVYNICIPKLYTLHISSVILITCP
jgi:hypothetical protein